MVQVAPSFLSADFLNLGKDIRMVNTHADILHLDIMDGVFVPNISYGFPVVRAIASIAEKPIDVHLMIVHPEKYALKFVEAGADMVSFHLDAASEPLALLDEIRGGGAKAGLVINPDIPVESLYPYIGKCDYFLLMSVFAGFGGQKFIEDTYPRLRSLKAEISARGAAALIEIDGGVGPANAGALAGAGADILVAGSSVFCSEDPAEAIRLIRGSQRT